MFRTLNLLRKSSKAASATPMGRNIPTKWQSGVSEFLDAELLPYTLGGKPENIHLAWFGDKVLGFHVAESIFSLFGSSLHRGVATEILSRAVSNRFMKENVDILLPVLSKAQDLEPKMTDHNVGTIVETAVARLSLQRRSAEIKDLAQFLLPQAVIGEVRE